MNIQKPYLLFLGDAHDQLAAKVADGIKQWHPEYCVGQYRMANCHADCQLTDMDIDAAVKAGQKHWWWVWLTVAVLFQKSGFQY
jgi:hypothetical protein